MSTVRGQMGAARAKLGVGHWGMMVGWGTGDGIPDRGWGSSQRWGVVPDRGWGSRHGMGFQTVVEFQS